MEADLLIHGARVVLEDGIRVVDVAVTGDRISAVGADLPIDAAAERVDGSGRLLCPGFVDLHAHSCLQAFDDPLLTPKVAQGFTTELICPDGLGPAPLTPAIRDGRRRYLQPFEPSRHAPWDWSTLDDYLAQLQAAGPATNVATCVPHGAVREVILGPTGRRPDAGELRAMQDLVRECFDAGARALSFGLIYAPGLHADTAELTALAEVAAEYAAPVVPHVRNEARGILESIGEFVQVAQETGAPLHVSHLKLVGCPDLLDDLHALLTGAQERISLTFDQYPYGAGSTILAALLPPWAADGGPDATLGRLRDPAERLRMARDMEHGLPGWENLFAACGPGDILVSHAAGSRSGEMGRSIADVAAERGVEPAVAVFDLLADTGLDVGMIDHYATEATVRGIFTHRAALVGSDGVFGPRPHPRLHGTAAKVLGRWALREGLVTVREAVARLAGRPARLLGLHDRGRIAEGLRADLVLLSPDSFVDTATYDDPCRTPPGVDLVTVGGNAVWRDGAHTGARPGRVVRSTPS